jgi:hypothetical protein
VFRVNANLPCKPWSCTCDICGGRNNTDALFIFLQTVCFPLANHNNLFDVTNNYNNNFVVLVRKRPTLVGEVSANFSG